MRVLIVDDHQLVLDTLAFQLTAVGDDAVTAGTISDAVAVLRDTDSVVRPDVVLLDCFMPDAQGLEGLKQLLSVCSTAPIVLMSGKVSHSLVRQARDKGASGFVSKSTRMAQLRSILQAVIAGCPYFPPEVFSEVGRHQNNAIWRLSEVNKRILTLVCKGLTNRQIAQEVGMKEYNVKGHLRTIFHTLGVSNRTQAAMVADKIGFAKL